MSDYLKNAKESKQYLKIKLEKPKNLINFMFERFPKMLELEIFYMNKENKWKQLNFDQLNHHNYFPNDFLEFYTKGISEICLTIQKNESKYRFSK